MCFPHNDDSKKWKNIKSFDFTTFQLNPRYVWAGIQDIRIIYLSNGKPVLKWPIVIANDELVLTMYISQLMQIMQLSTLSNY